MYLVGNTNTDVHLCLCIGCLYENGIVQYRINGTGQ